jgi:hypothetical protein
MQSNKSFARMVRRSQPYSVIDALGVVSQLRGYHVMTHIQDLSFGGIVPGYENRVRFTVTPPDDISVVLLSIECLAVDAVRLQDVLLDNPDDREDITALVSELKDLETSEIFATIAALRS